MIFCACWRCTLACSYKGSGIRLRFVVTNNSGLEVREEVKCYEGSKVSPLIDTKPSTVDTPQIMSTRLLHVHPSHLTQPDHAKQRNSPSQAKCLLFIFSPSPSLANNTTATTPKHSPREVQNSILKGRCRAMPLVSQFHDARIHQRPENRRRAAVPTFHFSLEIRAALGTAFAHRERAIELICCVDRPIRTRTTRGQGTKN
jgi:hypothetical protein